MEIIGDGLKVCVGSIDEAARLNGENDCKI